MSYDLKDHRESQNETAFLLAHENIYQVTKMSFSYMKYKASTIFIVWVRYYGSQ